MRTQTTDEVESDFKRLLLDIPETTRCAYCDAPNAYIKTMGFGVQRPICEWCEKRVEANMLSVLERLKLIRDERADAVIRNVLVQHVYPRRRR